MSLSYLSDFLKKGFAFSIFSMLDVSCVRIKHHSLNSIENCVYSNLIQDYIVVDSELPATSYIIRREGYSLAYDPRTRNSIYVYEKLTTENLEGRVSRDKHPFREDFLIPDIFRSKLKDYEKSGYDRGHLAPAANHKSTSKSMGDTFYLSNICPQTPQFNRGYWLKLEKYVRNLTKEYRTVEVFSGPLYLPQENESGERIVSYKVIGENDVAVPTHFYKVLFLENISGEIITQAYILPNVAINASQPLDDFKTTTDKVQKAAGVLFKKNQ